MDRHSNAYSILALLISGVAINWLSGAFQPAAPAILFISVIALFLLYASAPTERGPLERSVISFGLVSFLLGAIVAAIWILPIFPSVSFETGLLTWPFGGMGGEFWGYEWGAASTLALVGSISAARRQSFQNLAIFVFAAITGLSTVVAWISPHVHDVVVTVIGWNAYAGAIVGLVAIAPEGYRMFSRFISGGAVGIKPLVEPDGPVGPNE